MDFWESVERISNAHRKARAAEPERFALAGVREPERFALAGVRVYPTNTDGYPIPCGQTGNLLALGCRDGCVLCEPKRKIERGRDVLARVMAGVS